MSEQDEYLKAMEVCAPRKISRGQLYALVKEGKFPRPIKFGAASRWSARDIAEWEARQKSEAA